MYTDRSPIYVRTVPELTALWRAVLPADYIIGEMTDQRWQSVLWAARTKKMVLLSWNECNILFVPGDAWGEKMYTHDERKTVACTVELITQLLSYKQNHDHPVIMKALNQFANWESRPNMSLGMWSL